MTIDINSVGAVTDWLDRSWNPEQCIIYALGVGAGSDDPDGDLKFTVESTADRPQAVIPTFALVAATTGDLWRRAGTFDFNRLVHGEAGLTLHQPLVPGGSARVRSRIVGLFDQSSGALVEVETEALDAKTEAPLWTASNSAFIRGEGGFGGERRIVPDSPVPAGVPDEEISMLTRRDQALLYRLTGDRNPVHSEPSIAHLAGFDRPILHGLCTYGFTGRALLKTRCANQPERFHSISGRFTKPVHPGEKLTVRLWDVDAGTVAFQTVDGSGETVIDRGLLHVRV